jgi:peptidylprolyl isomerase
MAGTKTSRQQAKRRAAEAAAAAARHRARRKRLIAGGVTLFVIIALVSGIFIVGNTGGSSKNVNASSSTTAPPTSDSTPAAGSAAGKPCVAVADPLPAGAPAVPVKVGPPPTELIKEDLKEGTGAVVNPGDTVTVNYIGVACSTGKIFDSSYSRNQTATFPLSGVIKGWTDGIPGMKVGGQRLLGIPSDQAYGPSGQPPDIAPDEALWFVVEVTDTKKA